jgi:outer membrane autotransporter protein
MAALVRFGLAGALLAAASITEAQTIEKLPIARSGDRVTVSIRVLEGTTPLQQIAVGWDVAGAQPGDRALSSLRGVTDERGIASFSMSLAAVPGTREIFAAVPTFQSTVSFLIDQSAFLSHEALGVYQTLPNVAIESARTQMRNVARRIRERRGGGPAVSLFGNGLQPALTGSFAQALAAEAQRANDRTTDLGGRFGVFVNGQGSGGTQDTTANIRGYRARTLGLTGGGDYRVTDNFILGAAVGVLRADSEYEANAGETEARGLSASAFGTWYAGQFYLDALASYGWNWYDTTRNAGAGATAQGSTRGQQLAASLSSGFGLTHGAWSFGPYLRLAYIHVNVNEFTETGASGANLQVGKQSADSFTTALGVQASRAISTSWGVLSPQARVEWEQEHRQDVRLLTGTLVSDPLKTPFAVPSDEPDRSYFNVGLGLAAQFPNGKAAYVTYEGVFGRSGFTNHSVVIGGRMEF